MTKSTGSLIVRCASVLLVLLLLMSVVPFPSLAAENKDDNTAEYVITGKFAENKFDLSGEIHKLFHLENIAPGDKWTGTIRIKNEAPGQMGVKLLSINSNLKDTTLFDALDLKISHEGKVIYSGSYDTNKSPITQAYNLKSGKYLVLDVEVTLPLKTGNEVQNKEMDSTWTFEAYYSDSPKTGWDLPSENTANLTIVWVMLFALLGAAIITVRIRAAMKAQREVNRNEK